ncbi:hypothetical protein [Chloroflexus sp.]|uniref:hypothetical protein n=1 Tax=Chloroflexus sp. TaxID=1904827 RepID=UPI00404AE44B
MRSTRTLLLLLAMILLSGVVSAQSPLNRAGVVVRFGDGEVVTACVEFSEPTISGLDLLERSGLPVISQQSSIGAAVCKIGREGCDYPATGCFCARDQGRAVYWAFYRREAGAWRYSSLGASNVVVSDGDLHGWAWGPGDASSGAVPPDLELTDVCKPLAEPAPTTVPAATITPASSRPPTATVLPTMVPIATASSTPTAQLATAIPTALPSPTAIRQADTINISSPSPAVTPVMTPPPAGSAPASSGGQWLGFLLIAAVLIGGIVATLSRQRSG